MVAAYSKDMVGTALKVAKRVREAGLSVDVLLEHKRKVWQAFDHADRVGARFIAFVGPDEWAKGMVRVKSLRQEGGHGADGCDEGKQIDVPWEGFSEAVRKMASQSC